MDIGQDLLKDIADQKHIINNSLKIQIMRKSEINNINKILNKNKTKKISKKL